jgi:hypothetical protein
MMFYPCRYVALLISWYIYRLPSFHHLLNLNMSSTSPSPTKPTNYESVTLETSTNNFTFLYNGLCRKIQIEIFSRKLRNLPNLHSPYNNFCNSGPIHTEKNSLDFCIFSLPNCTRIIYNTISRPRNTASKNSNWTKNTSFSENKKIVVALEHLLFGTETVVCKIVFVSSSLHKNCLSLHPYVYHKFNHVVAFDKLHGSHPLLPLEVLSIHPWMHCKQFYSSNFTLNLPCKFFYDIESLTNILLVILSGHIERHLITVAFTITYLQPVFGTQVAHDLWTFIFHTASPVIYSVFTDICSSKHSRLLQLLREHLLHDHCLLFSIQFMSYSIFLYSVFLLHIPHVYNNLLSVEFNWSGVTLTRQTGNSILFSLVVKQLTLTTPALCELIPSLLWPAIVFSRTVIASRLMSCFGAPSPFLLSPVISVHHITGLPRVHTPT